MEKNRKTFCTSFEYIPFNIQSEFGDVEEKIKKEYEKN